VNPDAIVIGAGIFGSLITQALRQSGLEVFVVDARRDGAGSPPAACLMKPGWYSALGKDIYAPSLQKLDSLVGVQELTFRVNKLKSTTVQWCNPKRVLLPQIDLTAAVKRIDRAAGGWQVVFARASPFPEPVVAKLVVVAIGVWTPILFSEIKVEGQAGVAWLWPEEIIEEPFIEVWAPYKQIVAFNRGDGLWVGDGTSVRNWNAGRREASRRRCVGALPQKPSTGPIELFGYRSYVSDSRPCLLRELKPGLWVATGGAKNGTLAAGWCADQITRAVL
jgi:glycine/D-amino acid oxidase-like deaminating enzyme